MWFDNSDCGLTQFLRANHRTHTHTTTTHTNRELVRFLSYSNTTLWMLKKPRMRSNKDIQLLLTKPYNTFIKVPVFGT